MKIQINRKEYGLKWGVAAIDRYATAMGMEDDLDAALTILFEDKPGIKQTIALAKFVSAAIESYATLNNTEGGASHEQVLNEFDDQGPEYVALILKDFMESKISGKSIADYLNLTTRVVEENATGKKKPQRRKS